MTVEMVEPGVLDKCSLRAMGLIDSSRPASRCTSRCTGLSSDSMSEPIDITLPKMPDCWESCGNCAGEAILVTEVLVEPGEWVWCDDPLIMIESDKTLIDIPAPKSGRVVELLVEEGQEVEVGDLLLRLDPGASPP